MARRFLFKYLQTESERKFIRSTHSPRLSLTVMRFGFPLLLGLYLLLSLGFSVIVPLGEAPDEVSHYAYIDYVRSHWQMPTPEGPVVGESHQPPLYYLIGALATFWIPNKNFQVIANPDLALDNPQTPNLLLHPRREDFPYRGDVLAWHIVRVLSILMGAVTVWATWRLATEFFPMRPALALASAAFVAFLPEFVFISAAVNNDNLVVMLSSLALLQIVRLTRRPVSARAAVILGIILGLATLTKLSGLVLWLFATLAFFYWACKQGDRKKFVAPFALCFGIAGLIVAPWLLYNWFNLGDPLGWSRLLAVTPVRQVPITLTDWASVAQGLFTSFWGRFGGALQIKLPDVVYGGLGLVGLLALAGWLMDAARGHKLDSDERAVAIVFAVFWLIMLAAFARWTLTVLGTDQARQLFPGLPLLAIFLVTGLASFFQTRQKIAQNIWSGALLLASVGVLFYLNSLYSAAPVLAESLRPLGGTSAPLDFGRTIRLLDFAINPLQAAPGQAVIIEFQWQALTNPKEDYWLQLQLVGEEGEIATREGVPAAGRVTTDRWQKGQVFTSRHSIVVPQDAAPANYTLQLGLHPFRRFEWLLVEGQDTIPLGIVSVGALP